jgi:glycosyltransferase involved in cell wall biosynthesis
MPSPASIHVLTLTPFYPSRDDERGGYVAEPLREFDALGMRSSIFAVRPLHKGRVLVAESAPAASWMRYPAWPGNLGLAWTGRLLYLRLRSQVRQLHQVNPIQILHAHAALPCGEAARLLRQELGIPFIVTVHGLDAYLTEQVSGAAGARCKALCRDVYGQAKRVICISEQVRQRVLAEMPELQNTTVVYNGVDPEVFSPPAAPARDASIVSVGSLIPIKGHDVTLRALGELVGEFPDLRMDIVGEGGELDRLSALARELGVGDRVQFLGRQTRRQVAELLRGSQIFALPSRYEGLGVAYLEAMASGLPVIAYRGQGIQEVIRHNDNGILITEQSENSAPRAWASVLRTLLKNEEMRRTMGAASRRTITEGYTLRHQAQALLRVYEECRA